MSEAPRVTGAIPGPCWVGPRTAMQSRLVPCTERDALAWYPEGPAPEGTVVEPGRVEVYDGAWGRTLAIVYRPDWTGDRVPPPGYSW